MKYRIISSGRTVGHANDIIEPLRRGLALELDPLPAHTIILIQAPQNEEFIFEGPLHVPRPHTASLLRNRDTISVLLRRPWPGGALDITDLAHIDQLYRITLTPAKEPHVQLKSPPARPTTR